MALAIEVTLESPLAEAEAAFEKAKAPGKALARETDKLDSAARRKGAQAITALLSESQAKLIEQMKAEGFDPTRMRLPPEQWFPASEGLKTVRGIAEYVSGNLNDFKRPNPILKDLRAVEALLVAAEAAGIRFHFTKTEA
jgi:hypothetical protein